MRTCSHRPIDPVSIGMKRRWRSGGGLRRSLWTLGRAPAGCSLPTFRAELKRLASTRAREGKRSEYHSAPIVWYLSAKDPLHGVRPFEIVHIDETPLDVVRWRPVTRSL
jgi:hypothetical protein